MSDQNWGPLGGLNSKSYMLYMEKEDVTAMPQELPNHGLGGVSQNLIDALMIPRTVFENGRMVTRYVVSRPAEETHREYTLTYPMGLLYSPARQLAEFSSFCKRDFFANYLCPDSPEYAHYVVFKNAMLTPPVETEDFITLDDNNAFGEQSTMQLERRMVKFAISGTEIFAGADDYYAVEIGQGDCLNCEGKLYGYILVGGGDGTLAPLLKSSEDGGETFSTVTVTGATVGNIIMDIWRKGDVIILALANNFDHATATAGEIMVSLDGGTTWAKATGPSNAYFAIAEYNGAILVAGCDGEIWKTTDYVNFTQLSEPAGLSAKHFTGIAVDETMKVAYLSATDGGAAVVDGDLVGDMSATLSTADDLLTVAVLAPNHIVFAGEGGLFLESTDGGDDFVQKSVAGTTANITKVAGTKYRTLVAAGTHIYERSLLTNMLFTDVVLRYGQTIAGIVYGLDVAPSIYGDNFFVAVDVTGDVFIFRPRYPGA